MISMPEPDGTHGTHELVRRVVATFDAIADSYDQGGVAYFGPIADRLVAAVAPQPGETVLDVGCGRGAVTVRLAQAVRPGGRVTGIDLSTGMLRALDADLRAEGYDEVELLERDASAPGVPDSTYDAVTASLVLFFLPDPAAAVRAWREALRPGGRLGFTTFGIRNDTWSQIDALFEPYLPPALLDARTSGQQGPFASPEATTARAEGAGLVDVRTVEDVDPVRYDSLDAWHDWSWTVGLRALWLAVPEDERPVVKEAIFETLAPEQTADGSVLLQQTVRVTTGRRG
jgi:ubiquinone/menaquinone biosynthesis C-methylase UbiE